MKLVVLLRTVRKEARGIGAEPDTFGILFVFRETERACRNQQALRYLDMILEPLIRMCLAGPQCLRRLVHVLWLDPEDSSIAACASRNRINGCNINLLFR